MHTTPRPTEYSIFLDTTELHSALSYVDPPISVDRALARISYYVSSLTITELAVQLLDKFNKLELKQFESLIGKVEASPDLNYFRTQIKTELARVEWLKIFDPLPHGIEEQNLLFEAMVFGSAVAYAKSQSLPRCHFVSQDKQEKDFVVLQKMLDTFYPMRLLTRDAFKQMLRLNSTLYEGIIQRLQPMAEERVKELRSELVTKFQDQASNHMGSPEVIEMFEEIRRGNLNTSVIASEVRNINIGPDDDANNPTPASVRGSMYVRYVIPGKWARLYSAGFSAALFYSGKGELTNVNLTGFDLDWAPFA